MKEERRKKKQPMKRTSVQLPGEILDKLANDWPEIEQSERIRIALERYSFLMDTIQVGTEQAIERHLDVLVAAMGDFDYGDARLACRAMPSLVRAHIDERARGESLTDQQADSLLEWIDEASPRERLHMLDAAISRRIQLENDDAAEE